jgi:hypothetical protein
MGQRLDAVVGRSQGAEARILILQGTRMKHGWGTEPLLHDADKTKWDSKTLRR